MESKGPKISQDLLSFSPVKDENSLVINTKKTSLEELRKNFKAGPSSVLSKVQNFLPKMASANMELQKQIEENSADCFDIEHLEDEGAPHIEMNLALVEQEGSCSESSDDETSDDNDIEYGAVTEDNIKLPYKNKTSASVLIQPVDGANESSKEPLSGEMTNRTKDSCQLNT